MIDFDHFFYYGNGSLEEETKSDIQLFLGQERRTLFYSRNKNSAGITDFENIPQSVMLNILIKYKIVSAVSSRNNYVETLQTGTKDRRIATSQNLIKVSTDGSNLDIEMLYVPFSNIKETKKTSLQIGIGNGG